MSVPAPLPATQAHRTLGLWPVRASGGALFTFVFLVGGTLEAHDALPLKDRPHLRSPVAAAWLSVNDRVAVANRCGTISVVDAVANEAITEIPIGERLADIEAHPSGRLWLAVDESRHELIELVADQLSLRVMKRHAVARFPVDVAISADGKWVAVASLWSRKATIFAWHHESKSQDGSLKHAAVLTLSFNPGKIEFDDAKRVVPKQPSIRREQDQPEISGSAKYLFVRDAFGNTTALLQPNPPRIVEDSGTRIPDTALPYRSSQDWGEMLTPVYTYGVGLDETRFRLPKDGSELFYFAGRALGLGPTKEALPAERGERLFKGTTFGSYSCDTCHKRGHTSYALADTLADDTRGTPKRIPSLLGTRLSDPWAWSGKFRNLDEQVRSSLETTMHVTNFTPEQVGDLTAFLHTLKPPPPLEPATDDPADQAKLARGKQLFSDLGCAKCHVPPLTYTSADTYDVGLADEAGMTRFNPPSLRGVSQGYSFFHDGRAKTLEEVFTVHGHQLDRALSDAELADLLRFLRSL